MWGRKVYLECVRGFVDWFLDGLSLHVLWCSLCNKIIYRCDGPKHKCCNLENGKEVFSVRSGCAANPKTNGSRIKPNLSSH